MKAGRLRHRCTLEGLQRVPDGLGGHQEQWQVLKPFWAEVSLPRGKTQPGAPQLQTQITAELIARPDNAFRVGHQVLCRGKTYRIDAVLPDNRNTLVRLLCSAVPIH